MPFSHKRDDLGHDWLVIVDPESKERRWPLMWWEGNDFGTARCMHRTRAGVMRFESGWDVSIIWGTATYSTNYHTLLRTEEFAEEPHLVEMAIRRHDGQMLGNDVLAYICIHVATALFDTLERLPTDWQGNLRDLQHLIDEVAHER